MPAVSHDTTGRFETTERALTSDVRAARGRAFGVLLCVIAGILLARALPGNVPDGWLRWAAPASFGVAAVLGLFVVLIRGRLATPLLAIGVVCLWIAWTSARLYTSPNNSLLCRLPDTRLEIPVLARGVLMERPEVLPPDPDPLQIMDRGSTGLTVELTSAMLGEGDRRAWAPVSGGLRVFGPIDPALYELEAGDSLELRGTLLLPQGRLNPGEPDWLALARQRDKVGSLLLPDASLVTPAPPPDGLGGSMLVWRARGLGWLRARAARAVGLDIPANEQTEAQQMLSALLLGVRSDPLDPLPTKMRRLGLAHLMAISGFHLALAAGFALLVMRVFRDWGRAEPLMLAALVVLYMLVLPVRVPVLRAGLMVLGLLLASGCGRRYDGRGVLCWIAVGLLAWRPMDLSSAGFQLSLGITALLIARGHVPMPGVHERAVEHAKAAAWWPVRAGRACVECWAAGQPAILAHFGTLSPFAWLTTLVVVLPITALLGSGYLAMAIGAVWPPGGRWLMGLIQVPAGWVVDLVTWMDALPWVWFSVPRLPPVVALGLTLAVLLVVLAPVGLKGERRRWPRWAVLLVAVVVSGVVLWRVPWTGDGVLVRIDTVAVDNGSCWLVRSGDEAVLIDAGSLSRRVGQKSLPRAFGGLGVSTVPTVIVTHPNLDHYNALPDLAEPHGIETVYLTAEFFEAAASPGPEAVFVQRMKDKGAELRPIIAGDTFIVGSARLDVLWPAAGLEGVSDNDTSVMSVLRVTSERGERSLLLTGDAGEFALSALLEQGELGRVDAMELPHHGSYNIISDRLVRALDPALVVQSTGLERAGDPRWDGAREGRLWKVTAVDGCVTTRLHADGRITVRTQR